MVRRRSLGRKRRSRRKGIVSPYIVNPYYPQRSIPFLKYGRRAGSKRMRGRKGNLLKVIGSIFGL